MEAGEEVKEEQVVDSDVPLSEEKEQSEVMAEMVDQEEQEEEEFKLRKRASGTETTSTPSISGEKFLQEYYDCLSKDLDKLVNFYHEDAVMTLQYEEGFSVMGDVETPLSPIGREISRQPVVNGKADIEQRLKYIYKGRKATVTSIDCQMSSRGTMLLVASGTLDNILPSTGVESSPIAAYYSVHFVQSFIVSCLDTEFKIMNDILRKSDPSGGSQASTMTPVPQLITNIGTPVIGGSRDSKFTPLASKSSVKSKSTSTTGGSSRKSSSGRKRRKSRRPTPKRLFQPVSLTESLVEDNKGKGNNLAALMQFIANLCEILVNSVWSAVAILHVVGTLSLLLSVSAMFLKSRNDLVVLEQKAKEIEYSFRVEEGLEDQIGNIDVSSFLKVDKMGETSGKDTGSTYKSFDIVHSNSGQVMNTRFNTEAHYLDNSKSNEGYLGSYSGSALLTSLQNGEFPVKVGSVFTDET